MKIQLPTTKVRNFLEGLLLAPTDGRIYACVRIAFASAALANLLLLWPERGCFLTDGGMIDQEATRQAYIWPYLTVFDWCRDDTSVAIFMLLSAAAMIMLLVGKMQRLAALLTYVWHVSYTARAATALCGWDELLRSVSFLLLLAPLPAIWSLDKPGVEAAAPKSYGLTLMRFQLLVIYWQTVLERLDDKFWLSGEFMGYYLLSQHARWPAPWLVDFDMSLRVLTYLILIVEAVLPLLLISRKWHRVGMLSGFLLHFGIFVTSYNLLMFLLAMMVLYVAFLRTEDINWMSRQAKRLLQTHGSEPSAAKRKRAVKA